MHTSSAFSKVYFRAYLDVFCLGERRCSLILQIFKMASRFFILFFKIFIQFKKRNESFCAGIFEVIIVEVSFTKPDYGRSVLFNAEMCGREMHKITKLKIPSRKNNMRLLIFRLGHSLRNKRTLTGSQILHENDHD